MSTSWYTVNIARHNDSVTVFDGYFSVNNDTNLITGFFETIGGSTDFNNNILIPTGSGTPYGTYLGFQTYIFDLFVPNNTQAIYNNAYISSWLQFWAIIITSMSTYPEYTNLYLGAANDGDELISNSGILYSRKGLGNSNRININVLFTITPVSSPFSNICFPAGTLITTNQGNIPIEKINPAIHTINNKKIVDVTKTITNDDHLVCFEKHSIKWMKTPSQRTIITKNHCILYKGAMIKAKNFIGVFKNVKLVKYTGEILYNVSMETHDTMSVNNLICERLHPENIIAKLYRMMKSLTVAEQHELVKYYNECVSKRKSPSKMLLR
jgi:hypothetical protein